MMKNILLAVVFTGLSIQAFSQDDDDKCQYPTNKKILNKFKEAGNEKLTGKEQYQALKDALALDEHCVECMYQLGVRAFNNAQDRIGQGMSANYDYAEKYFTDILSTCPQYHADPYYYLGVINYLNKNNAEAARYFNLFLNYKGKRDGCYADDHQKKLADVKDILPELEFSEDFFKKQVPFNPVLVEGVSTAGDEYLPMLSPDNEMIFYTRKKNASAMGDIRQTFVEEFTLSLRDDIAKPFDNGAALPKPFNIGPNYGGSTISIDNKELIVCACKLENEKTPKEYKNCDLYSARYEKYKDPDSGKERYKWGELVNLGPAINTSEGWEAQPSLSADGKTLFFATNREGSRGIDIYYSTRQADGKWAPARTIGDVINTDRHDKTPFIHTDSKTLYFTSEVGPGRLGAGGYDIFYSRQGADGKWSKPVNLGNPINTAGDEHGLVVSTDGRMAYFDSERLKGKGGLDVYRFELYPEARPEKVVIVKGDLKDANGNIVPDAKVEIKYADENKVEEAVIDKEDGKFYAVVKTERPQDIVVTVKKEGSAFESKLIAQKDLDKPVIKNNDLTVTPLEKGKSYTLNDILFATDSYDLSDKSKFVIDQFIDFLKETPRVKIEIQGHTDNEGDPAGNLALSDNRARVVMEYIVSKGINASRMTFKGYGQTKPKVPNTSPENKAKNRRTEFFITEI